MFFNVKRKTYNNIFEQNHIVLMIQNIRQFQYSLPNQLWWNNKILGMSEIKAVWSMEFLSGGGHNTTPEVECSGDTLFRYRENQSKSGLGVFQWVFAP